MGFSHRITLICLGATLCVAAACVDDEPARAPVVIDRAASPAPWTHLKFANDPDEFQFVIVSDRTGGHREGVFGAALEKVNLLRPEFVMSIGDLIEGYTEDPAELKTQWDRIDAMVRKLDMPFFYVGGNHDLSNPVMADCWRKRYGREYYHFVYRDVLFLCLSTEDTVKTAISDAQIRYVAKVLADHAKVRWTLVFMHQPLWVYEKQTGWAKIETLLAERPYTVFAGHFHNYTKHRREGRDYYVLATTGGGSGLKGPAAGEFDHVVWVTMTDAGPRIANLALDGILRDDVRTQEDVELAKALRGVVTATPLPVRGETFAGGVTELRIRNPIDRPVTFAAELAPGKRLRASLGKIQSTVAPKSQRAIKIKLEPSGGPCPVDTPPVVAHWKILAATAEGRSGQVEGKTVLGPTRVRVCPVRSEPVVVDGKLDEWPELPLVVDKSLWGYNLEKWTGPGDCSFRFAVARDAQQLYVAVAVTDDKPVLLSERHPWEQDSVQVYIDPVADPSGKVASFLHMAVSLPAEGLEVLNAFARDKWPAGTQVAGRPTAAGCEMEFAIPLSYLDAAQGGKWRAFRLNVGVEDLDGEEKKTHLKWQPKWSWSDRAAPGAGTFVRE